MRRVIEALLNESDTRIPKGYNTKSEDYISKVQVHNQALVEVANALNDIGYRQ